MSGLYENIHKKQKRIEAQKAEDYKQALKMEKMEIKIDELEFELYVKKAERTN